MDDGPAEDVSGGDHPPRCRRGAARLACPRGEGDDGRRDGHAIEKDALPAERIDEKASDERAHAEAQAETEACPAQSPAVSRGRQGQRHERRRGAVDEAPAHPLEHANDEEHPEGRHDGEGEEAEERQEQARAHDAPGPEPVGEHAGGEGRHRIGPHIADDDPADGAGADVEGGRHSGKRDVEGAVETDEQKACRGQEDGHATEYTVPSHGGPTAPRCQSRDVPVQGDATMERFASDRPSPLA